MNFNRRWLIISLAVFALAVFVLWQDKKEVIIIDGQNKAVVKTSLNSIRELLKEETITLGERDKVQPGLETKLLDGMTITITRARDVVIQAGDEKKVVRTTSFLTDKVLQESGIVLGDMDRVYPARGGYCLDLIRIVRVEKKEVSEEKAVSYPVHMENDDNLYKGEKRIKQKGIKGLEKHIYEVVLENGEEVSRRLIEKVLVKKPVQEIVAVGTIQTVSRGGQPINFKEVLTMTATGYTHTGNRTYTDIWPSVGTVAVDPRVIPLRTRLYIDGYGYATAMDIGSAIKGNRIDLFFETRQEALKWGRRSVKVFILE